MNGVSDLQTRCVDYLSSRISDYEFRCRRFKAVADKLNEMGFQSFHSVMDIGAGRQDFERYLREKHGWLGRYFPIDGSIDGTDLNMWRPSDIDADWLVAIEVVEHLQEPEVFIQMVMDNSWFGAVITTPNPAVVDVLACDPTHVSIVGPDRFPLGWHFENQNLFGKAGDTIVATHEVPEYVGN